MSISILSGCTNPKVFFKNGDYEIYSCGQCPQCRKKRMKEWIFRSVKELETYNNKAIFLTHTYDDKHLIVTAKKKQVIEDARGTLVKKHMSDFFKKLRGKLTKLYGEDAPLIRYIYCGEYGGQTWRPHYHNIIFGLDKNLITRELLQSCWEHGKLYTGNDKKLNQIQKEKGNIDKNGNVIDCVNEHTIEYTVGYAVKKLPPKSEEMREMFEDNNRVRPYLQTSKGIGRDWALNHLEELSSKIGINHNGLEIPTPRYYFKLIYKAEGFYDKWDVYETQKINGQEVNVRVWRKYKLTKNINGKMTKRITELLDEMREESKKKNSEIFSEINQEDLNKIYNIHEKQTLNIKKLHQDEYEKYMMLSILSESFEGYDIKSLYYEKKYYYQYKINVFKKRKRDYMENLIKQGLLKRARSKYNISLLGLSEKTNKQLEEIAKAGETKILNGRYGKRETMENNIAFENSLEKII